MRSTKVLFLARAHLALGISALTLWILLPGVGSEGVGAAQGMLPGSIAFATCVALRLVIMIFLGPVVPKDKAARIDLLDSASIIAACLFIELGYMGSHWNYEWILGYVMFFG